MEESPGEYKRLKPKCTVVDCGKFAHGRGMCDMHLYRWNKYHDCEKSMQTKIVLGEICGRLEVIELLGSGNLLCVCLCGSLTEVKVRNFRNGHTASCGCLRSENKFQFDGRRFGMLVVICYAGVLNAYRSWLCHCDCGETKIVSGAALNAGRTKSCGCQMRVANIKFVEYAIERSCNICGRTLPVSKFNIDKSRKRLNRTSWCKECTNEKSKARHSVPISDAYIANQFKLPVSKVPKELLNFKREHLRLVRLLKEKTK